jgi:DNA-binding beta-propeller fold protein YncE
VANIHSDAVARFIDGKVFIINRLNRDSVLILNPANGFLPEAEYSVGKGNNPQDIVKVNDNKAYITLYNSRKPARCKILIPVHSFVILI